MVSVRAFITVGLGVIAVVFILLGLFSNGWATYDNVNTIFDINYGLREVEIELETGNGSIKDTEDLSTLGDKEKDLENPYPMNFHDFDTAGLIAYIILWAALAVCMGGMVLAAISAFGKMNGTIALILHLVSGGLILLAVICYFGLALPMEKGSEMEDIGWTSYLVFLGGVLLFTGGGLLKGIKKDDVVKNDSGYGGQYEKDKTERREYRPITDFITNKAPEHKEDRARRDYPPPRRHDHHEDRDRSDYATPRRDDYYDERERGDYPPPRREDYHNDGTRSDRPHRRSSGDPRERDDLYERERSERDCPPPRRRDYDDYPEQEITQQESYYEKEYESLYRTSSREDYQDYAKEKENDVESEAISVLKGRLVRGEITKEEYEDLKRVIEE